MAIKHYNDANITLQDGEEIEHAEVTVHSSWIQFHSDGHILSSTVVESIIPTEENNGTVH